MSDDIINAEEWTRLGGMRGRDVLSFNQSFVDIVKSIWLWSGNPVLWVFQKNVLNYRIVSESILVLPFDSFLNFNNVGNGNMFVGSDAIDIKNATAQFKYKETSVALSGFLCCDKSWFDGIRPTYGYSAVTKIKNIDTGAVREHEKSKHFLRSLNRKYKA